MKGEVALLGGDLRQVYLAKLLAEDGWKVSTWGLDRGGSTFAVPLHHALDAELVVLPLPVSKGGMLHLPLTDSQLEVESLWQRLCKNQLLLGGLTGEVAPKLLKNYGLTLLDYYQREEVQILNAVPTAEGAIARAMEQTDITIQKAKCLVVGYGRVGKVLARRLQAIGADVTVAARRYSDLAFGEAFGHRSMPIKSLVSGVEGMDVIFNTVPATVLTRPVLAKISSACVVLELASSPGGIDRTAALELGIRVVEAPGLPGMVAPRTAAMAIRQGIYHILEERGDSF